MPFVARLLSLFLASLAFAAFATAQVKYVNPEKFERATKQDDKGLTQWAEWKAEQCANCKGTGKTKCITCERFEEDSPNCPECQRNKERQAPCRACAGTGSVPDPLEKVACPGCLGSAILVCLNCGGGGRLKVGGAKEWSACPVCRGEGGLKCTVCAGKRVVEATALKPSLRDASSANLQKALTATDAALKGLAVFEAKGGKGVRKEIKAVVKALEAAQAYHPAMKRLPKAFEDYMGKLDAASQFMGQEEREVEAMKTTKQHAEYYLKHQKRMIELARVRAEANEKLAAENKGK